MYFSSFSLFRQCFKKKYIQYFRSRTGSTTVDLSDTGFKKPKLQYLNQSKSPLAKSISFLENKNDEQTAKSPKGAKRKITDLHIGALFPMTSSHSSGWLGGVGCKPAINMALKDVNNAGNLLSGYHLVLHSNDSKVRLNLKLKFTFYLTYLLL